MTLYRDGANLFTYADMVAALAKDPKTILEQLQNNVPALDAWHAATGIAGEAGELLDAVKKHAVYARAIDRANVVEELGDLRFYMQHLQLVLGITDQEVLDGNVHKLVTGENARYKGMVYSDAAAHARADKVTGKVEISLPAEDA